jgi:hypothetical protein
MIFPVIAILSCSNITFKCQSIYEVTLYKSREKDAGKGSGNDIH